MQIKKTGQYFVIARVNRSFSEPERPFFWQAAGKQVIGLRISGGVRRVEA